MKRARAFAQPPMDRARLKGFYRVQVEEDGRIVGDSGFLGNQITNEGFDDYLCRLLAATDSSKQVRYVALGTGTAPASDATGLPGEVASSTRKTAVTVAINASKTVTFTATFASNSAITSQHTLQNIGLFDSTQASCYLFAGSTYPTSTCNSNQAVNITYQISFG